MDIVALAGIAVGLSMDAFAVSVTNGAVCQKANLKFAVKLAFSFGFFQALMPTIGWLAGKAAEGFISSVDHWVALILLCFIGIQMLVEAFKHEKEEDVCQTDVPLKTLMALSIATSIDALATGIILPSAVGASTVPLMLAAVGIIGLVTFVIRIAGVYLGKKFGALLSKKAEILGGLVLIAIGLKIFIEHMFFS